MKILVVDDDLMNQEFLEILLGGFDHQVVLASDGESAIEQFTSEQPDLILMDIVMPGMDGYIAARRIKSIAGDNFVPIIFLSSLTSTEDFRKAIDAGGDDFLFKPYNSELIKAKIDAMSRIREFNVELQQHKLTLEKHQKQQQRELKLAEHIFRTVVNSGSSDIPGVRKWVSSASVFCGDLLLCTQIPSGSIHILLGDFTGHGLTAAIGALPASDIFYGMSNKGLSIKEIATELNRKLFTLLPTEIFCAASLFEIDIQKMTLGIWNGGLPNICIKSSEKNEVNSISSTHPPLGIMSENDFDSTIETISLYGNEKVYAYTDGLSQLVSDEGEKFGDKRVTQLLRDGNIDVDYFERLRDSVQDFLGVNEQMDDISLVEIDMTKIVR